MRTYSILRASSLALAVGVALASAPLAFAADMDSTTQPQTQQQQMQPLPQQEAQLSVNPTMQQGAQSGTNIPDSHTYQDYVSSLRLNPDVAHSHGW